MIIYVKNMVCNRCILVVKQSFMNFGIEPTKVNLGEVYLDSIPPEEELLKVREKLIEYGFEPINDIRSKIINIIKVEVVLWVQEYNFRKIPYKFSAFISSTLKRDYNYLSNLFSEVEGQTIEQYLILQRIEKVKELLVYDELSLNEIATNTGFSSGAHLSSQFKKMTGLSPSHFKKIKENKRMPIDDL